MEPCFKAPRQRDHIHYIQEDLMSPKEPAFLTAEKSTVLPVCRNASRPTIGNVYKHLA